MLKIITHTNPDLDAVASVWLIKRFLPGWQEAEIEFVTAKASTKKDGQVDQNPDTLWVDVGRGKLDHHQSGQYSSAAKLCFDYIGEKRKGRSLKTITEKALKKLVQVVTAVDNARDLSWEEVKKSRYHFQLHNLIEGWRSLGAEDSVVMEYAFKSLDAVLMSLKSKLRAEDELKEGIKFKTPWGKAIGVETGNRQTLWVGEAQGYVLVVIKDPKSGGVKMYARPDSAVDLTQAYQQISQLDPKSDWFLHASKKLLLNQSSVNPEMRPTKLSLTQIIEVFKEA